MNDEYRQIFQIQYDENYRNDFYPYFRDEGNSGILLRRIHDYIERAAENAEISTRLRSDARFFVLINLYEMVAKPVMLNQLFSSSPAMQTVFSALNEDLAAMFDAAKSQRVQGDITGGDMVRSLAEVYDKLKLTSFEVWG